MENELIDILNGILDKEYFRYSDLAKKESLINYNRKSYGLGYAAPPNFLEETVLFLAIKDDDPKIVENICKVFGNIQLRCSQGHNAIYYAVEFAGVDILNVLLNYGCNVLKPSEPSNPIIRCVELNKVEMLDVLIENIKFLSQNQFDELITSSTYVLKYENKLLNKII